MLPGKLTSVPSGSHTEDCGPGAAAGRGLWINFRGDTDFGVCQGRVASGPFLEGAPFAPWCGCLSRMK